MKKILLKVVVAFILNAFVLHSLSAENTPSSLMNWVSVQTNLIDKWKAEYNAPSGVVADKVARKVRFLVEATSVGENDTIEFFAIGPLSDRAYESFAVSVASPADIVKAVESIGVPRGVPVSNLKVSLWPQGEKLTATIEPYPSKTGEVAFADILNDVNEKQEGAILKTPLVWTGGARDELGNVVAATNIPCAVFALYGNNQSLLQLNGIFDQSTIYGRFRAKKRYPVGELFTVTLSWDGRKTVLEKVLEITPATAKDVFTELKKDSEKFEVFTRLKVGKDVTVAEAVQLARAYEILDGVSLKMNGREKGQFYYRSFVPDEKWRVRKDRIFQPFEVRVKADGSKEFTFVEEDWSGEGLDPVLKPRTTQFKDWKDLLALISKTGRQGEKVDVMFLFVPSTMKVSDLSPVLDATMPRLSTFYIFAE